MIGYGTLIAYAGQTVTLQGTGELIANNCAAYLSGTGSLSAKASQTTSITLSGTGYLYAVATGIDRCSASLPAMQSLCGNADNWSFMSASLPALQSLVVEEAYVPAFVSSCAASLPALMSLAISDQQNLGHVSASLQPLVGLCADYDYGLCSASLPAIRTYSYAEHPLELSAMSTMYIMDVMEIKSDLILVFNSTGTLESIATISKTLAMEAMNTLQASGLSVFVSSLSMSLLSTLVGVSVNMEQVGTKPVLDETSRVWVVNMDTFSTSQYDDYGFTEFYTDHLTGISYGIAEDGIYELTGDTDAGNPIDALIDFGRSDLGSPQKKHVPCLYTGISSTGKMLLKVDADGQVSYYEARKSSTEMKNQRFDINKRLTGNYWNFTLINQAGCDFDLETINFEPQKLLRKI